MRPTLVLLCLAASTLLVPLSNATPPPDVIIVDGSVVCATPGFDPSWYCGGVDSRDLTHPGVCALGGPDPACFYPPSRNVCFLHWTNAGMNYDECVKVEEDGHFVCYYEKYNGSPGGCVGI